MCVSLFLISYLYDSSVIYMPADFISWRDGFHSLSFIMKEGTWNRSRCGLCSSHGALYDLKNRFGKPLLREEVGGTWKMVLYIRNDHKRFHYDLLSNWIALCIFGSSSYSDELLLYYLVYCQYRFLEPRSTYSKYLYLVWMCSAYLSPQTELVNIPSCLR